MNDQEILNFEKEVKQIFSEFLQVETYSDKNFIYFKFKEKFKLSFEVYRGNRCKLLDRFFDKYYSYSEFYFKTPGNYKEFTLALAKHFDWNGIPEFFTECYLLAENLSSSKMRMTKGKI